jgi:4-carboxymuconolactone decarboxylase
MASLELLPLDENDEVRGIARVEQVSVLLLRGIVHYTAEVLFRELWLCPDLAPESKPSDTSAFIAAGQVAQISFRDRAMATF